MSRPAAGDHSVSYVICAGNELFPQGLGGHYVKLTCHLHLLGILKLMALYLHSPHVFIPWCPITGTTLHLPYINVTSPTVGQQTRPSGPGPLHFRSFTITLRRTTLGRTPLDEWPARRRDLYLTHNTHNKQTSMLQAVFELAILASERPQTHALDRAATGIGHAHSSDILIKGYLCKKYTL
jgi:hypothetical protein